MLIRDRMTSPALTIEPRTLLYEALALMKSRRIRRLPVVKSRRLVGIVTFIDLMRAHPSPANSLAVWEIPALLLKTHVSEIMTKDLVTISPTESIEEAAVLMRQHKIGGLPVVEQGSLIGIITESDIFEAFVELMGLDRGGPRLTISLDGRHRADRLDEAGAHDSGLQLRDQQPSHLPYKGPSRDDRARGCSVPTACCADSDGAGRARDESGSDS